MPPPPPRSRVLGSEYCTYDFDQEENPGSCIRCGQDLGTDKIVWAHCNHHMHIACAKEYFTGVDFYDLRPCLGDNCQHRFRPPPHVPYYIDVGENEEGYQCMCEPFESFTPARGKLITWPCRCSKPPAYHPQCVFDWNSFHMRSSGIRLLSINDEYRNIPCPICRDLIDTGCLSDMAVDAREEQSASNETQQESTLVISDAQFQRHSRQEVNADTPGTQVPEEPRREASANTPDTQVSEELHQEASVNTSDAQAPEEIAHRQRTEQLQQSWNSLDGTFSALKATAVRGLGAGPAQSLIITNGARENRNQPDRLRFLRIQYKPIPQEELYYRYWIVVDLNERMSSIAHRWLSVLYGSDDDPIQLNPFFFRAGRALLWHETARLAQIPNGATLEHTI